MSSPFEWRLPDVERKADEALRIRYEVATLRGDVDSLERANRELRSDIDWLRIELQTTRDQIRQLMEAQK